MAERVAVRQITERTQDGEGLAAPAQVEKRFQRRRNPVPYRQDGPEEDEDQPRHAEENGQQNSHGVPPYIAMLWAISFEPVPPVSSVTAPVLPTTTLCVALAVTWIGIVSPFRALFPVTVA